MPHETQFVIEPRNKFVEANRFLVEREIRSSVTVTFQHLVDLTQVDAVRSAAAADGRPRPSYTAFVVKAVAGALREFPYANRRVYRRPWPLGGARLQRFGACDVAVACERSQDGAEAVAFIDILRGADQRTLAETTVWLHALGLADAQSNKQWREFSNLIERLPLWLSTRLLRMPVWSPSMWVKYRGGAVLISSPAKYGIDVVAATWPWPLGVSFGIVQPRPAVREGRVVALPSFVLTLNFDRRIMAGAPAARFFRRIVALLEHARTELVEDFDDRGSDEDRSVQGAVTQEANGTH